MSKKAIVYARFSTSEQRSFSLERQHRTGQEFAQEQGWEVEKLISDEARSAFHGANRYEGAALHEFEFEAKNGVHAGKVLLVENLDRLSRQGAKAAAQLIWGLNENGVDVATYHDGHIYRADNSNEMLDIFKLVILAQQAHEESSKKSKRTIATWKRRFERIADGTQIKPIPYLPHWLDRADTKMVLNEKRTALLNEIYDLYIAGQGVHRIVTLLNERGEPTWTPPQSKRADNGWFYSYVYRLLTKRAVLGEYVTAKGETLAANFFPQAISADKWNRAQAVLAMRKSNQKRSNIRSRNLLAQIVVCSECGGGANFNHTTDTVQKYTKVSGEVVNYRRKTYRRLRCDRARRKHNCDNDTILNYDIVEATILNEMLPQLVERPDEDSAARQVREQLAQSELEKAQDETRLSNLIDALAHGGSKAVMGRIADLEAKIAEQATRIEVTRKRLAIEASRPVANDDVELVGKLREDITSEDDEVREATRARVNLALRRLIARIAINPNGTFQVEPDDKSCWIFDDTGELLEGYYVLE